MQCNIKNRVLSIQFEVLQIVIFSKLGKPVYEISSYVISLLLVLSNMFKNMLPKDLIL